MPEVVWKYVLRDVVNEIELPSEATVLTVAAQNNAVCLWAKVDPGAEKVTRTFRVTGTGHAELTGTETYLGSALTHDGLFAFHVFESEGGVGGVVASPGP